MFYFLLFLSIIGLTYCNGNNVNKDSNPDENSDGNTDTTIPDCNNNCYYIRAGATGSNDGTNWTDAWTQLPGTLTRGNIYYIAEGSYPGYTFDDSQSGDSYIYIIKATSGKHGTDTGWDNTYGDDAIFGPINFTEPYYEFNGQSDQGFEVVGGYQGTIVNITADHIILKNNLLNGNFQNPGDHVDGACAGLGLDGADYATIKNNIIYDVADDGVAAGNLTNLSFISNTVYNLHGCGTDGGCGPCYNGHSDGIELYNVDNSEFVGNFIYSVSSTSALYFGDWASSTDDYCNNLVFSNNILYNNKGTGFTAYIIKADSIKFYNNTFWGIPDGAYGGLSIGPDVTNLDMYNNIILSVNYSHLGTSYDSSNHRGNNNLFGISLGQYQENSNDIVSTDPDFTTANSTGGPLLANPVVSDFNLNATSPAIGKGYPGDTTIQIPQTDLSGNTRNNPPSIGAME